MIARPFIAIAALSLTACATAPAPHGAAPIEVPPAGGTCSDANIQQYVGRERSAALEAEMLRASGAAIVRWVPVGTMITMEFRADRLTVYLDAANRIERIGCN